VTFDPLQLLRLAEQMEITDEAHARTAVNRAYYGVFLRARDGLRTTGLLTREAPGQVHGEVIAALRLNRRHAAATQLRDLREARERADYETTIEFSKADVDRALAQAREVARLLSRDWSSG
jgi:uncharacterized protein (UPF0332 family)